MAGVRLLLQPRGLSRVAGPICGKNMSRLSSLSTGLVQTGANQDPHRCSRCAIDLPEICDEGTAKLQGFVGVSECQGPFTRWQRRVVCQQTDCGPGQPPGRTMRCRKALRCKNHSLGKPAEQELCRKRAAHQTPCPTRLYSLALWFDLHSGA